MRLTYKSVVEYAGIDDVLTDRIADVFDGRDQITVSEWICGARAKSIPQDWRFWVVFEEDARCRKNRK